jgi:hypothetical protein
LNGNFANPRWRSFLGSRSILLDRNILETRESTKRRKISFTGAASTGAKPKGSNCEGGDCKKFNKFHILRIGVGA